MKEIIALILAVIITAIIIECFKESATAFGKTLSAYCFGKAGAMLFMWMYSKCYMEFYEWAGRKTGTWPPLNKTNGL